MKTHPHNSLTTGVVALALGTALVITGCSANSDGASPSTSGDSSAGAEQSSTLRVAVWGGPSDVLDITQAATQMPYAVLLNVYDSVALLTDSGIELQLATSVETNDDATEWTVTIRDDATFHNGDPVTATDVLYSLGFLGESPNWSSYYADIDFDASHTISDTELVLSLNRPRADFLEAVIGQMSVVFPDQTTDFTHPVGSGPFELESFSADSGAVLVRNDDYWDGAPAIETIELVSIADATARQNALTGGQVDYAVGISPTGVETLTAGGDFQVDERGAASSTVATFHMNTSIAPFDNPQAREAMKLLIDRQQLVDVIFRDYGEIGNDLIGKELPGYAAEVPQREHDPEAAQAMFAELGITEIGIVVAETYPGLTDSTTILQQQLADVGVTLNITEADPSTLFNDLTQVYSSQMFTTYFVNRPAAVSLSSFNRADSPYNFSQWQDGEFNDLLQQSQTTVDDEARADLLVQAQERLWSEGGDIAWGYQPDLSAFRGSIQGVALTQAVPLFGKATFNE